MNEEAIGALTHAGLVSPQLTQTYLLMLGGQIISGLLIAAGIIAVAILAHAIIHGLIVRNAVKTKTN